MSIVGCEMKHISKSYHGKHNFISVHSALCIKNSTDIFFMDVNISNSTGIGLLMYDTSRLVNVTWRTLKNNTLSPLDAKASGNDNETSGGQVVVFILNLLTALQD